MLKLVRTTVTGALVFVLPVGIIAIFVGKIITSARGLLEPLSEQLPVKSVAGRARAWPRTWCSRWKPISSAAFRPMAC